MEDRIVILSSGPGRISTEFQVGLPRPRLAGSPHARALIEECRGLMTMWTVPGSVATATPATHPRHRLPEVNVTHIEGVFALLAGEPFNGRVGLPKLAEETELSDEELFLTYEALSLLGFAQVEKGDITLTPLGQRYAEAEQPLQHDILSQQLLTHLQLAARIWKQLEEEPTGMLSAAQFIELMEDFLEAEEASRVMEVAVEWGRYGEVYEYDYHMGRLKLPDQEKDVLEERNYPAKNPNKGAARRDSVMQPALVYDSFNGFLAATRS